MPSTIALRVVLLLQIFRRLQAHHSAELAFADDAELEVLRPAKLLALLRGRKAFRAHDHHRGLRGHFVAGGAAELNDERLRFLAAKRGEFAGEDDNLIGERGFVGLAHAVPARVHASVWSRRAQNEGRGENDGGRCGCQADRGHVRDGIDVASRKGRKPALRLTGAGKPSNSRIREFTTSPRSAMSVSRVISSAGSMRTLPSLTRCSRNVVMFFAYIWLA